LGSSLTTIPSWGPRRKCGVSGGGVWRLVEEIWVKVSEGRVGAICFYFPQPLAFFGFSPHNFLIGAKMHKSKKGTKGRRHDPILTLPTRLQGRWT